MNPPSFLEIGQTKGRGLNAHTSVLCVIIFLLNETHLHILGTQD